MSKPCCLEVIVRLSEDTPVNQTTKAQLEYALEAIRRHMKSFDFQNGLLKAMYGQPIDGAEFGIGRPCTYKALEESYMRLKYGRIEPEFGHVHPDTFDDILSRFVEPNDRMAIRFNAAKVIRDSDVPVGKIRWFYGNLLAGKKD